ncbi:MAG TPA: NF038122 family metalloprotease [Thermoanaerobaculia bacterium]|nr:NF038122 family metalloprotease [Thermoanaerobaculia bacterium]
MYLPAIGVRGLVPPLFLFLSLNALANGLSAVPSGQTSVYVVEHDGRQATCRFASPAEAEQMSRPYDGPLTVIGEGGLRTHAGLNIILRATPQLAANPAASAAFERAAEIWESLIADPITVFIDVDFGLTRFGVPFNSPNILGGADNEGYYIVPVSAAKTALIAHANNAAEAAIYAALPSPGLPTDRGTATSLFLEPMVVRVLGDEPPAAEDDPAPRIGFNAAFAFDLDPSNGIAPDQTDFEAVALHELGHVLGFTSTSGKQELDAGIPLQPSLLDLFRFRPGVTLGTFTSAQRVQTSGGTHVYFDGVSTILFSTGRPDGSGGDQNQASHWKDDAQTGVYIGLMDPNIGDGERGTLRQTDLTAIGLLGYNIVVSNVPAAPTNLTATPTSPTTIALAWTDNAANEIEYRVEMKTGAGAFLDLGALPASSTAVDVINRTPSTTYTFRVRARNASGNSGYSNEASATTPGTPSVCTPNATTVCLLGNRFRVTIAYVNPFSSPPGQTGEFTAARLNPAATNPDTALFGFGNAQNVEVVVRVVDARPFAPRFDIYYGGLTDVAYTVTVTDTQRGTTKQYKNTAGQVGGGVDRATFPAN